MPFTKRSVSPVNVSQHRLPPNIRQSELECVANGTLANLIRQLSSLSRHAEDVFGELYREAVKIEHKTTTLFNRIDRLAVKVTQLDSKIEEVSLQDLHLRKPFKSSTLIDQQSLSRHTMPAAMAELHSRCDRPPDLDKLNQFRDDGKSGLKFYTDPDYFFALWREEMLKDADHMKKGHKAKNPNEKRRKPRQSHEHRQKYYDKGMPRQPVESPDYHAAQQQHPVSDMAAHHMANGRMHLYAQQQMGVVRPESLELQYGTSGYGSTDSTGSQQFRVQQQQRCPPAPASVVTQQYGVINRNQHSAAAHSLQQQRRGENPLLVSENSGGTTPTPMYELDQLSPRSIESMESGQSRGVYGYPRPSQPPPAPPPTNAAIDGQRGPQRRDPPYSNGDLPGRLSDLRLAGRSVVDGRSYNAPPPSAFNNVVGEDRSASPDLPPPPPPFASAGVVYSASSDFNDKPPSPPPPLVTPASSSSFVTASSTPHTNGVNRLHNGTSTIQQAQQAPPPPPPPPPPALKANDENMSTSNAPASASTTRSTISGDARTLDARSDLLKAIKQGIQLKKVDRQEEKARDDAAVEKGHDVAAILKRRMEDVMGRSESEGSASDFEDDWDD